MKKKDWTGFTAALNDKTGKAGKPSRDPMPWETGLFKAVYNDKKEAVVSMRFLPMPDGEAAPFVKHSIHSVYVDKQHWINEPCPRAAGISSKCPICEKYYEIYKVNKGLAKQLRGKEYYYANILIIKNPNDPESEGKVFLYKFGKTIYEKIMAKLAPQDTEIETPVNIFDYEEGANFILKIKHTMIDLDGKSIEMPNYDASEFQAQSKISLDKKVLTDAQIEEIEAKLYSIAALTSPKYYKTSEELIANATKALGPTYGFGGEDVVPDSEQSWSTASLAPQASAATQSVDQFATTEKFESSGTIDTSISDEDDIFSKFN
jgi:hypothetical protein